MNLTVEKFIKVYGSAGISIFPEGTNVEVEYDGDIKRTRPMQGYGIHLAGNEYRVFHDKRDAEDFYKQQNGAITSSNLVLENYGIRELE